LEISLINETDSSTHFGRDSDIGYKLVNVMVDEFDKTRPPDYTAQTEWWHRRTDEYAQFVQLFAEENGLTVEGYMSESAGWCTTSIVFKSKDDELIFLLKYKVEK
jgi:hypothetical protein